MIRQYIVLIKSKVETAPFGLFVEIITALVVCLVEVVTVDVVVSMFKIGSNVFIIIEGINISFVFGDFCLYEALISYSVNDLKLTKLTCPLAVYLYNCSTI